jgi:hypothetical protein
MHNTCDSMELSYQYPDFLKEFHRFGSSVRIVAECPYLKNKLVLQVEDVPVIQARRYVKMTILLTLLRNIVNQRDLNYKHSLTKREIRPIIFKLMSLGEHLFLLKQKYDYINFMMIYQDMCYDEMLKLTPPRESKLFLRFNEKMLYIKTLLNYDDKF